MNATVHETVELNDGHAMSRHAWERMTGRGASPYAVQLVLDYGRVVHVRGAAIHVVGKKEVARWNQKGLDLSGVEGLQVVCTDRGLILTMYRNRDFRTLRPRSRHRRRQRHYA